MLPYTDRVAQMEDGTFCWRCHVDSSVTGFAYRLAFGVSGGICAMFILTALFMNSWVLKITLLSCLAAMAVAAAVVLIFRRMGSWYEFYWMNDANIRIGTGKSTRIMEYDQLRRVIWTNKMIRLEKNFRKEIVFIPEGGYDLVRKYILSRIP